MPNLFNLEGESIDRTASVVFVLLIFFTIAVVSGIAVSNTMCKEKALFFFREVDLLPVTGGERKRYIGGVISLFYFLIIFLVTMGMFTHYFAFNSRVDANEVTNLTHKHDMPQSYMLNLTIYSSILYEDVAVPLDIMDVNYTKKVEEDRNNLCPHKIKVFYSEYFASADNKTYTCERIKLSDYTDAYHLNVYL